MSHLFTEKSNLETQAARSFLASAERDCFSHSESRYCFISRNSSLLFSLIYGGELFLNLNFFFSSFLFIFFFFFFDTKK